MMDEERIVSEDALELNVVTLLRCASLTLGLAESVTAGLISSRLCEVPGSSRVFRGAVIPYHRDLKSSLLISLSHAGRDTVINGSTSPDTASLLASPLSAGRDGALGYSETDSFVESLDERNPESCGIHSPVNSDLGYSVSSDLEAQDAQINVVSKEMVLAMASGACELLKSDVGLATTGVAGPDSLEGVDPGNVWIGLWLDGVGRVQKLYLPFARNRVRDDAATAALELLRVSLVLRSCQVFD